MTLTRRMTDGVLSHDHHYPRSAHDGSNAGEGEDVSLQNGWKCLCGRRNNERLTYCYFCGRPKASKGITC